MNTLFGISILSTFLLIHSCFSMEQLCEYDPNQQSIIEEKFAFNFGFLSPDKSKKCIKKHPKFMNAWLKPSSGDPCLLLHIAVEKNNVPAVRQLLQEYPFQINVATIHNKYTPLHMVNSKPMAKLLIASGAFLDSKDRNGTTPLYHVLFNKYSYCNYYCKPVQSTREQMAELAHYLLKKGATVHALVDQQENSLLHKAAGGGGSMVGRYPEYIDLLLQHKADIEYKNKHQQTAYEIAMDGYGHCGEILERFKSHNIIFIESGAFAWLKNNAKEFKEHINSEYSCTEHVLENKLADLFIRARRNNAVNKGAIVEHHCGYYFNQVRYIDLYDWVGKDAIEYVHSYFYGRCQQALDLVLKGNYKEARDLISLHSYILRYDQQIAFEMLSQAMRTDAYTFSYMLNRKPDLNMIDEDGNTLLHKAIELKNAEAIGLLIKGGALLWAVNKDRKKPIDVLVDLDDKKCLEAFESSFIAQFFKTYSYQPLYKDYKKIIQSGFDVNLCDEKGESMLWKAVKEHLEKLSLLLKHGAVVTQEMIDHAKSEGRYAEMELLQKYLKK